MKSVSALVAAACLCGCIAAAVAEPPPPALAVGLDDLHDRNLLLRAALPAPRRDPDTTDALTAAVYKRLGIRRVVDSLRLAPGMRAFLEDSAEAATLRTWAVASFASPFADGDTPLDRQLLLGFVGTDAPEYTRRLLALSATETRALGVASLTVATTDATSPTPIPGDGWTTPAPTGIPVSTNIQFTAIFTSPEFLNKAVFETALIQLFNLTVNTTSELILQGTGPNGGPLQVNDTALQWWFGGSERLVFAHRVYRLTHYELLRDLHIVDIEYTPMIPPPANINHASRLPVMIVGIVIALLGIVGSVFFAARRKKRGDGFNSAFDDDDTSGGICCCGRGNDCGGGNDDQSMNGVQDYTGRSDRAAYAKLR